MLPVLMALMIAVSSRPSLHFETEAKDMTVEIVQVDTNDLMVVAESTSSAKFDAVDVRVFYHTMFNSQEILRSVDFFSELPAHVAFGVGDLNVPMSRIVRVGVTRLKIGDGFDLEPSRPK